jgi:hypothetical protein
MKKTIEIALNQIESKLSFAYPYILGILKNIGKRRRPTMDDDVDTHPCECCLLVAFACELPFVAAQTTNDQQIITTYSNCIFLCNTQYKYYKATCK